MEKLVSVIVPVYNVEKYVDACIYSIVTQSYHNLEILVVDDGSTDSCGKICDGWAKRDLRVKVIHQKNQGLSGARNVAIDICEGEWITFIDSDDFVEPDYIKTLLELAERYEVKISQCSYTEVEYLKVEEEDTEEGFLDSAQFLLSSKYQTMAWGKIYKREIFKMVRFPYGKIHEDMALTYRIVYEAGRIAYTTKKLYFYRTSRSESIIRAKKFYREKLIVLQFLKEQTEFYEEKKEVDLMKRAYRDYAYALLENYNKTKKVLKDKEMGYKIKKEYRRICFQVIGEDNIISLKTKMLLMSCFVIPELWQILMKE